ncbi:MAG TPA: M3 family oligoendopeptidase, partial [Candidatus Dormibacteraeota bacterium]|nr:M3 family oligoendopeptidase [Candidatus Dormibacteraeota bacterium]
MIAPLASPEDLAQATWADIEPHYERLATQPLGDIDGWLRDWSRFSDILSEARSLAHTAYTGDTRDPAKEAAHLRFARDIGPRVREQEVRLGRRLLATGQTPPGLETFVGRLRNQDALFREANVPLFAELQTLSTAWQKLSASLTVTWDGRELPLPALRVHGSSPDRATRERAFRLGYGAIVARRDDIQDIFDSLYALRQRVAANAGFETYRDYAHAEKNRFSYTVADCLRFHDAVERTVVPALRRRMALRARRMGLDGLRPWDGIDGLTGTADSLGRQPLRPFPDVETLGERAQAIFTRVDPVLGDRFGVMRTEHLLDLESRQGKVPGGYCTSFPFRRRPFIFMNATGVETDLRTLLHEAGHAFHGFEVFDSQPLAFQRHPGAEMAEVASMSMELLAAPYLGAAEGGFFSAEDERRSRIAHLEGILNVLVHIATVDAFQQWIYTSGEGHDRDARDREWRRLRERFEPWVDWSDLDDLRPGRWLAQPHVFVNPFYYVEYGIAQMGALQVWRNALRDQAGAVAAYREALALGATRPLPELFA